MSLPMTSSSWLCSTWQTTALGTLHRLFDGELPVAHRARKAAKPDLEALAQLPPSEAWPQGALLALGSGSRPQRHRAALLEYDEAGDLQAAVREIDLSPLYAPLHVQHEGLNIEGAFAGAGRFCLLQRGNSTAAANVLIAFDWLAVQAWLSGAAPAPRPVSSTPYTLGDIDCVPLCFTDGAALAAWPASATAARAPSATARRSTGSRPS
jgi:hypothetical protein